MKTRIKICLSLLFLSFALHAQDSSNTTEKNAFFEWNVGVAYINETDIFPGTSALWGKTFINKNNVVFEYEAGFALPTIVTAKVGIGKRFDNTTVIAGVRPFPFNLFIQSSLISGKKGYWMCSIEYNPLGYESNLAFDSKAILNFGYRWHIFKK